LTVREQIIYDIDLYKNGTYDVATFCDVFGALYYYVSGGHTYFSNEENEFLEKIGFVAERYTSSADDLKEHPQIYYSGQQAKETIDPILEVLSF